MSDEYSAQNSPLTPIITPVGLAPIDSRGEYRIPEFHRWTMRSIGSSKKLDTIIPALMVIIVASNRRKKFTVGLNSGSFRWTSFVTSSPVDITRLAAPQ